MAIRILLIHWNAREASGRARALRSAKYAVSCFNPAGGPEALKVARARPPDAFVIDLSRLPAQGRAVAVALRQYRSTRDVPIVFVGGEPAKVAATRKLLPDAAYADWSRIRTAIKSALANPPRSPEVPNTMAGYSGTPLHKKLGIKPGGSLTLLGAPAGFEKMLGPIVAEIQVRRQARGQADLVMLFSKNRSELTKRLPAALRAAAATGNVWLCWPKKASGVKTDLTEQFIRDTGLAAGWVDFKIAAIDATWSGLRFARRKSA